MKRLNIISCPSLICHWQQSSPAKRDCDFLPLYLSALVLFRLWSARQSRPQYVPRSGRSQDLGNYTCVTRAQAHMARLLRTVKILSSSSQIVHGK